ncbi:MAG: hypothetical protein HYZ28_11385 [Myxococcales bacterium]|nr:hypothetical protein [Myxococcales bacterium]
MPGAPASTSPTPEEPGPAAPEQNLVWTSAGPRPQDSFASPPLPPAPPQASPAVEASIRTALDRYTARLESMFNPDAASLARGATPLREGEELTEAQESQAKKATTDFLRELPLAAFSPEVSGWLRASLAERGVTVRNGEAARLADFGKAGEELVKQLAGRLEESSPTAYYSLAAGLAGAAGYAAWSGGSQRLKSLGIKPEVGQSFFDGQLKVKLGADFGPRFENLRATANVSSSVSLGSAGRLSGTLSADTRDGLSRGRISYGLDRPDFSLSAGTNFNRSGFESVDAQALWRPREDFHLSAGLNHNFQTDRTTATAEASWKVNRDVDFALSASHDSAGESRVGVGLRIRF